ncbi:MAG TPA: HlyD family secretion protein [Gammaproteobacteria bacterium]|nr:HlyD family secretion protein [Gammaproteobacteria bacterium]
MKRSLRWGLVGATAVAVAVGGYFYYRHGVRYPGTDDAYVAANVVHVTTEVTGRTVAVPVSNQALVHQGQLLFRLDPRPFRYRLQQAQAALALTRQRVTADEAAVQAAQATVQDRQARLENARRRFKRTQRMAAQHLQPQSALDDARTALDSAKADLALAKAKLNQARKELGTPGQRNQRIQQAQARVRESKLDLEHASVQAPCTGQLSGVGLQVGDMVNAGDPQFALVCSNRYWVEANFKETDITRVRPGQIASISVDMYPGRTFHGVVESVNPASGTAFSLLPPENATGNWVKVTQRVPVRILVVDASRDYPLRVQTSTEVSIDTGPGPQPYGRARGQVLSNTEAVQLARTKGLVPDHAAAHVQRGGAASPPADAGRP